MKTKFLRFISKLVKWLLDRKRSDTQQIIYGPKKIVNKNVTTAIININGDDKHS